jgi:hypothetical protein
MPESTLKEKANGSEEKSKEEGVKEVVAHYGSREVSVPVIIFLGPRSSSTPVFDFLGPRTFGSRNVFSLHQAAFHPARRIRDHRSQLSRLVNGL